MSIKLFKLRKEACEEMSKMYGYEGIRVTAIDMGAGKRPKYAIQIPINSEYSKFLHEDGFVN
jgi:hypothetical protein